MQVIQPHTSECMNCEFYIASSALPHTFPLRTPSLSISLGVSTSSVHAQCW